MPLKDRVGIYIEDVLLNSPQGLRLSEIVEAVKGMEPGHDSEIYECVVYGMGIEKGFGFNKFTNWKEKDGVYTIKDRSKASDKARIISETYNRQMSEAARLQESTITDYLRDRAIGNAGLSERQVL